jgi:hypothetical protein
MKKILILFMLCNLPTLKAQEYKNSFEFGINGEYFISKIQYHLPETHRIKIPYIAYIRQMEKYYLKFDYSWTSFSVESIKPLEFEKDIKVPSIYSKNVQTINFGIAPYQLFGLKNTLLFANISYIDYVDNYVATIIKHNGWNEPFVYTRVLKKMGCGLEVKQRFLLINKVYAHINIGYNYYFQKNDRAIKNEDELVTSSRFATALGIDYRF